MLSSDVALLPTHRADVVVVLTHNVLGGIESGRGKPVPTKEGTRKDDVMNHQQGGS